MNAINMSSMSSSRDRAAEVRARSAEDGITLLDGLDAALVGAFRNQQGKLVAVYEESLILGIIRNRLKAERPNASNDDLDADSADLLGDLARTCPYMGNGAPIIMEGLEDTK